MEELLAFAILLYEGLVTADEYHKRLDELFLENFEDDDLLYLECEADIKKLSFISEHIRTTIPLTMNSLAGFSCIS